jgi:hypothetical protein
MRAAAAADGVNIGLPPINMPGAGNEVDGDIPDPDNLEDQQDDEQSITL